MVQPILLRDDYMNPMLILFLICVLANWILQLVFVLWVLGRNKKLTMLLVEYYSKSSLIKEIENSQS